MQLTAKQRGASPADARPRMSMNRQAVIDNLEYFTEWGGRSWTRLCLRSIQHAGDLSNKKVLEIGPRYGKMSACFALLGAHVVGLEINETFLSQATEEVAKWGVQSRVRFIHYRGDLSACDELAGLGPFDVVFTKSVLVTIGDLLPAYLGELEKLLVPGGHCIFLENWRGGSVCSILRQVRASSREHAKRISYFTAAEVQLIKGMFDLVEIKRSLLPPICMIVARRRTMEITFGATEGSSPLAIDE